MSFNFGMCAFWDLLGLGATLGLPSALSTCQISERRFEPQKGHWNFGLQVVHKTWRKEFGRISSNYGVKRVNERLAIEWLSQCSPSLLLQE